MLGCTDGVFVRCDLATDQKPCVRVAAIDSNLHEIAPQFSDGALRLDVGPQDLREDDHGLMFGIVTDNLSKQIVCVQPTPASRNVFLSGFQGVKKPLLAWFALLQTTDTS